MSSRRLVAEADHLDEVRDEHRERLWAASPWQRPRGMVAPIGA